MSCVYSLTQSLRERSMKSVRVHSEMRLTEGVTPNPPCPPRLISSWPMPCCPVTSPITAHGSSRPLRMPCSSCPGKNILWTSWPRWTVALLRSSSQRVEQSRCSLESCTSDQDAANRAKLYILCGYFIFIVLIYYSGCNNMIIVKLMILWPSVDKIQSFRWGSYFWLEPSFEIGANQ